MRQLVVLSGKGGTGKTSVLAGFAQLASQSTGPVVAADADVEAANLALLLAGEDHTQEPFVAGRRARIDPEVCIDCGTCAVSCRFDAIRPTPRFEIDPMRCEGCGVCALVCSVDAVSFADNQAGWLLERTTSTGPLCHARLGVAQDSSGKLVAAVRQRARAVAEQQGIDLVLVDGPPGIGCPVHAALTGCDRAIVVTEPTASGEHDLVRLLDLVEHFRMRAAVLINKHDLAPAITARIEALAARRAAPVVGRIPFDRQVPAALARGELPLTVESFDGALRQAWAAVCELLEAASEATIGRAPPPVEAPAAAARPVAPPVERIELARPVLAAEPEPRELATAADDGLEPSNAPSLPTGTTPWQRLSAWAGTAVEVALAVLEARADGRARDGRGRGNGGGRGAGRGRGDGAGRGRGRGRGRGAGWGRGAGSGGGPSWRGGGGRQGP